MHSLLKFLISIVIFLFSSVEVFAETMREKAEARAYWNIWYSMGFQIWIILAVIVILIINYKNYTNKRLFFRSNLFQSFAYPMLAITLVFILVTSIFESDKRIFPDESYVFIPALPEPPKKVTEIELLANFLSFQNQKDFIDYTLHYYTTAIEKEAWIKNYYKNFFNSEYEEMRDVSFAALGYVFFKYNECDSAIYYFKQVPFKRRLPISNYFIAECYKKNGNIDSSIAYFNTLTSYPAFAVDSNYYNIIDVYVSVKDYNSIKKIAFSDKKLWGYIGKENYLYFFSKYSNIVKNAVSNRAFANDSLCYHYANYLVEIKDDKTIYSLLCKDVLINKYFNYYYLRKVLVENNSFFTYYWHVYARALPDINWELVFISFIIAFAWGYYAISVDVFMKNKLVILIAVFAFNFMFTDIMFYINDYYRFIFHHSKIEGDMLNNFYHYLFVVGFYEELVKSIPLLIIIYLNEKTKHKFLKEPFDYILLSVFAALGFATNENIMYFEDYESEGIIIVRALYCCIGHIVFLSMFAYGFVKYKFQKEGSSIFTIPLYFIFAFVTHGLYDFFVTSLPILSIIVFSLFFFYITTIWLIIVNNCINNSPYFNYNIGKKVDKVRLFMASLIACIIIYEYTLVAWRQGSLWANFYLFDVMADESILIVFLVFKISSFDLVKNYWRPLVRFTNPASDIRPTNLFALIADIFSANNIIPLNYVNYQIRLYWDNSENEIWGRINERIPIDNYSTIKNMRYIDYNWFELHTHRSLTEYGYDTHLLYMKMKDNYADLDNNEHIPVALYIPPVSNSEMVKLEDLVYFSDAYICKNKYLVPVN